MLAPKTNWLKIWLIILGVIIVAGLGVGGYFIYQKQIAATETANQTLLVPSPTQKIGISSRDDPHGPYYHQIFSATSPDGLNWTKQNAMLFDHASVPGAVIKDQTIFLYFVDASGDEDQLSVAISTDLGKTFEKKKVIIKDSKSYNAVDPHPELVDGKIRLYFLGNFMEMQPDKRNEIFRIYSAESNDGVNFENQQLAFEASSPATDPDVFQTEKDWRMFLSVGRNIILTISADNGITFQKDDNFSWADGGVPDTFKTNNQYHTFYCGEGGIQSATGAEEGKLTKEQGVRLNAEEGQIVCDPSIIKISDGSYLMFYKTQIITQQNQPNEAPKI